VAWFGRAGRWSVNPTQKAPLTMSQLDVPLGLASSPHNERVSSPAPSAPARARKLASRKSLASALVGWIVPLALLVVWATASKKELVAPQILPAPAAVAQTLLDQVESGELFTNFAISLARVAGGFALGGAIGVVVGVAMGLSRKVEQYLYPSFNAISQVPVLGWLPLAMMVLGIGESLKIVIIAHATLVPIALNALKGIRNVPRAYVEVAKTFEFSHRQLLRKVIFPASVPTLFVGIRYGLTQAWLSLVTVELLASSEGLGFMIVWGRQLFQLDLVLSAIIVVGVVGLLLDKGLERLEARLLRWRQPVAWSSGGQTEQSS
jgi:sulfonate transport system permease protein